MSANDKAAATYGPGRTTPPLEARIAAVRELHAKRTFTAGDYSHSYCDHCGTWDEPNYLYPCPTITALDGTS